MQRKLILAAALSLALGPLGALALDRGDVLGTDPAAVRQALEAQGYEVRKIEAEDDDGGEAMEAYALKDGKRLEIYVDRHSGAVQKIRQDD